MPAVVLFFPDGGRRRTVIEFDVAPVVDSFVYLRDDETSVEYRVTEAWHSQRRDGTGVSYYAILVRDDPPRRRWIDPEDYDGPLPQGDPAPAQEPNKA